MTQLRTQQEVFLPYLTGYVAFYLGDYAQVLTDLEKANQNDPFIQCLLAETNAKLVNLERSHELSAKAAAARAHNPPAAYAHRAALKR